VLARSKGKCLDGSNSLHGKIKRDLRLLDNYLRHVDRGGDSSCDNDGPFEVAVNEHCGLDLDHSPVTGLGMIRGLSLGHGTMSPCPRETPSGEHASG
jgi:hypothetical protein